MHGFNFYFRGTTPQLVETWLNTIWSPSLRGNSEQRSWHLYEEKQPHPLLYINLIDLDEAYGLLNEEEDFDGHTKFWLEMFDILGGKPDVGVHVEISGNRKSDKDVLYFVELLMERFSGVAFDAIVFHPWTHQEIQTGALFEGRTFWDYQLKPSSS